MEFLPTEIALDAADVDVAAVPIAMESAPLEVVFLPIAVAASARARDAAPTATP